MVLYNGHRAIRFRLPWRTRSGKLSPMLKEKDPVVALASPDVKEWVDEHLPDVENRAELRKQILRNPVNYFSRPANVPLDWRKEIYLPDFTLTLIRTPHLPPKYAQFWVPLWFNKLDLKDYLRRVYNVEVLHVRSYVVQSKVERKPTLGRGLFSYPTGPIHRPESKKKMTAELVNSFVWPDEITDFEPWEKDTYYAAQKESNAANDEMMPDAPAKPMKEERVKSIAEQAQDLLKGKEKWRPSWESIPIDAKALGRNSSSSFTSSSAR